MKLIQAKAPCNRFFWSLLLTAFLMMNGVFSATLVLAEDLEIPITDDGEKSTTFDAVCNDNLLCEFAINAVDILKKAETDDDPHTCYCHEDECPGNQNTGGGFDIDLDSDSPEVQTDCSGWATFALDSMASTNNAYQAAYSELTAFQQEYKNDFPKISGSTWPKAFIYRNFFAGLVAGTTSNSWNGFQDLSELTAGDVLAWCFDDLCDPDTTTTISGDTGHVLIVIAVEEIQEDDVHADHSNVGDGAQYWRVGVVDSSSVPHGSSDKDTDEVFELADGNTLQIFDSRRQYGDHPYGDCTSKGGLGSGIIVLAQWEEDGKLNWAKTFHDIHNNTFATSHTSFEIAFGRVTD